MNTWDQPIIIKSDNKRPPPAEWASVFRSLQAYVPNEAPLWKFMQNRMPEAQVFSFGEIQDEKLKVEATRGGDFWCAGHLNLPFRTTLYWYDHIVNHKDATTDRVRFATIATQLSENLIREQEKRWSGPLTVVCDFMGVPGVTGDRKGEYMLTGAGLFGVDFAESKNWRGVLLYSVDDKLPVKVRPDGTLNDLMGSLVDGVVGLSMILSTRGIPMHREEAPAKLNAKRARNGKALLPAVTHVDTRKYYEAMANTAARGTHASPVPHLRRGHIRRYTATGRTVWIRDMLVNCRSVAELKGRDHYEVEHNQAGEDHQAGQDHR